MVLYVFFGVLWFNVYFEGFPSLLLKTVKNNCFGSSQKNNRHAPVVEESVYACRIGFETAARSMM
jgi:hypothetical protein